MVSSCERDRAVNTEYFVSRVPANWTKGRKELHALKARVPNFGTGMKGGAGLWQTALDIWGADTLHLNKVVFLTTSDEARRVQPGERRVKRRKMQVYALMSYGHLQSSVPDDAKESLRDLQEAIQKHRITVRHILILISEDKGVGLEGDGAAAGGEPGPALAPGGGGAAGVEGPDGEEGGDAGEGEGGGGGGAGGAPRPPLCR